MRFNYYSFRPERNPVSGNTGDPRGLANPEKLFHHLVLVLVFLTAVIGSGSALYGQQRNHYRFQLQGVTDAGEAKTVTDILRPVFNTAADPFAVFPAFNDTADEFSFLAAVAVTKEQLEAVLEQHGITLLSFTTAFVENVQTEKQ